MLMNLTNNTLNQRIKQLTFYLLLVFLGIFLFLQMAQFLPAFLGAITFYTLSRKSMTHLVEKKKWKKNMAATLILIISFLVVVVPLGLTINILSTRLGSAINNSNQIISSITTLIETIEQKTKFQLLTEENLANFKSSGTAFITGFLKSTFSSITVVLIMYFILYFMLVSKNEMEGWFYHFIPLKEDNLAALGKEMNSLIISNALGIPLVALLQASVGLLCYLFLGVNDVWFWFIFTCIASMIPFVGSALAYVPLAIVLFVHHEDWKAIVLLIYGVVIIGTVDNVFRFVLQRKMGDVHPLITVFGVIIGVNIFGFIGLIFGPILISMFILLIKIYLNEFVQRRKPAEEQMETPAP